MDSPAWMFTKALSHRQKVCRLYKRALREVDAWYGGNFLEVRFQKCVMRARFDANRDEKDTRKIWEIRHPKPVRFPYDAGGSAYDRVRESQDSLLDTPSWTLPEKEAFPYYFNTREKRKKELLAHWAKIEKGWDDELAAIQTKLPAQKPVTTAGSS